MSINLSKAKVGDKFRTKNGEVVTYKGTDGRIAKSRSDYYVCVCSDDAKITYFKNGALLLDEEHPYDLVEQVFDDDKMEREIKSQKEMQESVGIEDEAELQRRQEVVALADRIFFSERGSAYSFKECIEVAEHSVNMINQYLKEGKL